MKIMVILDEEKDKDLKNPIEISDLSPVAFTRKNKMVEFFLTLFFRFIGMVVLQ